MRRAVPLFALTLLFALSISAQESGFRISPSLGPASGGTTVTITGPFGSWPYGVDFGGVPALNVTRLNENTLLAVTPQHLAGIVDVRIFEYDIYLTTEATFEFVGHPEREQYLLPVFVEPVKGAFGSEFRTELRGRNTGSNQSLEVWGIETPCRPSPPVCNWIVEAMVALEPGHFGDDLIDHQVYRTGTPGRFIEVRHELKEDFSRTLRVHDTSRTTENFGTEIPIVRTTDFHRKPLALLGVPIDPRFRNTLRLYGTGPTTVHLLVGNDLHDVQLRPGEHVFDPAYAEFTTFPKGTGTITVMAGGEENGPAVWGFITVTNNETQHITTITP